MSQSQQIANRLREVLLNGKWIANTNYKEQIESVTWEEATTQISNLNTIALLTFHVNYYLGGVLQVFNGGELEIRDKFSFEMPPIRSSEDWKNLTQSFVSNATEFADHVEKMDDALLNSTFVHEQYGSYLRNIEAMNEHAYYHLGQISLIKKLIRNK